MLKQFKLIFGIEADADLEKEAIRYEELQEGLGVKFHDTLMEQLELLRTQPEMFQKYKEEIRKGNMKNFPYSFYYQNDMPQEIIDILAVFAQAKNPEDIDKTLKKRQKK